MIAKAGSGHPGGSLSAIDLLVALFFHEMRLDPSNPNWDERDRFVLSKGHAVPALYAVLARKGALSPEELGTLRRLGSRLQGHPDRVRLPAVEASTGSLGQGLSIAQGMAIGMRLAKRTTRIFCLLGDGECQEGQVWEAAMSARQFRLGNLIALIDHNKGQIDGPVNRVMDIAPLADKWRAFGWRVQEIDGHDFSAILPAFEKTRGISDQPSLIIAHTVKGKGVSFMENDIGWHGVAPNAEQARRAIAEILPKVTS
jgi:transketolase